MVVSLALITDPAAAAPARGATTAGPSTAAPAHAASIARAGGAVSGPARRSASASTAVKTSGVATTAATALPAQLTASYDFTSYDAAEVTAVIDTWWPGMNSQPDGTPLGQLLVDSWNEWQAANPPSDWNYPEPRLADFAGASWSVTADGGAGSILTLTVPTPSGDVGATGIPVAVQAILTQLAGAFATVSTLAVCGAYLYGLPSNDAGWKAEFGNARQRAKVFCNWLTGFVAAAVTLPITWGLANTAPTSTDFPWQSLTGPLIAGAAGAVLTYGPAIIKVTQYAWLGLSYMINNKASPALDVLNAVFSPYLAPADLDHTIAVMRSLNAAQVLQLRDTINPTTVAKLLGLWAPVAAGYVGNVPPGEVVTVGSGSCLDAYGSNGGNEPAAPPAVPGQSVAMNACNGNSAQSFTFWPNGQIEAWGLCMDDPAGSNAVSLQWCDGGYTQLWHENGQGEIVNAATGNCLDDPGGNTTPGTQLITHPCNAQANQLWAPPGGTAAVTGYGPMYSVRKEDSFSLCMMPQTTLANPVGSNIITEAVSDGSNDCLSSNAQRSWARGSTGALMANGTNALCMDSNGPATTGPGGEAAYFVQLQPCDGSQSQVWNVVSTFLGPTLQNAGDKLCINTPSGQLAFVVSMVVASCADTPSPGELWTLPGIPLPRPSSAGGPCDIYASGGTPCAAAYSMTRALFSAYNGPLYQVTRASDGTTRDIGLLNPGGDVNASDQDRFCLDTACKITEIFDQSSDKNNLTVEGPGKNGGQDVPADAAALPIKVNGHEAYGLDIEQYVGYRNNGPAGGQGAPGIATGNAPEGMYIVASGTHVNGLCCFDFGNAETDNADDGPARMDAVNLGTHCHSGSCHGTGPWVQDDLENGLYQGSGTNLNDLGNNSDFVTAMVKNDGNSTFALKGGDSHGGGLSTWYNGPLPAGYAPMRTEGGITLGVGGDNSNQGVGSFFEGVMTQGYPSDAAEDLVQQNIVQESYSGDSNPSSTGSGEVTSQVAGPAVVHSAGGTGLEASGRTSVFTVDAQNGHLQETYLPYMGAPTWITEDLSAAGNAGTPAVKPDTTPVAVVRCGFTGVFTVDASNNHLQETYLPAIGQSWVTQDITAKYQTPPTKVTPTAVVHFTGAAGASAACGYSSVFTIDASNGHLDETYLTLTGQPWVYQELPSAPASQPGTSPVALYHDGYTSVYTVGADHHIYETHLKAIGDAWGTGDLTILANGPMTATTLTAVHHHGVTSVYAVGDPLRHLFELDLPAIGASWFSRDLTATEDTPPVAFGTAPVALLHTGWTTVYSVDEVSMHLQATYLSDAGVTGTQDLTAETPTDPPTTETPMAVVHPDEKGALTRTSVFTINQFNNHLQDTALVAIGDNWQTQDLNYYAKTPPVMVNNASPTASWSVAHDGLTSVFSPDPKTGDLTESWLTAMGAAWQAHDLTTLAKTPTLMPGTMPVTIAWDGHLAAFTVGPHGDLWETYLPYYGGTWSSQDLTATTNGKPTGVTPTAVFHGGYVSVYTVDDNGSANNAGDLRETYLPDSGGWLTRDLSDPALAHTPQVAPITSPVALYHDGYTSIYTADNNGLGSIGNDLQTTWLTAIGNNWQTLDLTLETGGRPMARSTTPAALYHAGYTSIYTADALSDSPSYTTDLRTTYLTAINDKWQTQDLSYTYRLPEVYAFSLTALYHSGFASVYSHDVDGTVHAAFLPAINSAWQTQTLPIPPASVNVTPSPLVHYNYDGGLTWTSLYTINKDGSLQGSFLPRIGDSWSTTALPQ